MGTRITNTSGEPAYATLATTIAGEDLVNNVQKVEERFSSTRVTADGQIMATAGFVHTVSISPTTATPTAGLLTIYDSATEAGTAIYSEWVFATTVGHTIILDRSCSNGCFVGYDGTLTNVSVAVSFRLNN